MTYTTTDIYFRFGLERQICLFASIFVFSSCLLISLDNSIICQDTGKKKLSKSGIVFLKIVSEQSTTFETINSEYFVVLGEENFIALFGKNTNLEVNTYGFG